MSEFILHHSPPRPSTSLFWSTMGYSPTDYAFDPVEGELLQATAQRVSIGREAPRAGVVHVHFPRIGFEIKAAEG